jgi:hypothetical protein
MRTLKARALANKQYISVIRLFQHCDVPAGADLNLPRAKKQLLAEFAAAEEGFIEVDGHTYSRHDVLEEIERPDFPSRLTFHEMIWKSPQMLQLLEENTADITTIREAFDPFWNNEEFDHFFSPYFCGPFAYLLRTLLTTPDWEHLAELLCFEGFLEPTEREEALKPIRLFLDENRKILRNVSGENYGIMRPKMTHWVVGQWAPVFNNLPHEFYDIKNDITLLLINIGVGIQKSHRRDCRKISAQLIELQDLPENVRETIVSNHFIYAKPRLRLRQNWWVA